MAEPFKNIYNDKFFSEFTQALELIVPHFDKKLFYDRIFDNQWENRELKQRMKHISMTLKHFLPADYKSSITKIIELLSHLKDTQFGLSLEYMFLPDFIEQYGLEDY